MTEQRTSYEQGQIDGTWTAERLREEGVTAEETLARLEGEYTRIVALMQARNTEGANQQIDYWNGLIAAAEETLRALM
jgi:hypothetical protein